MKRVIEGVGIVLASAFIAPPGGRAAPGPLTPIAVGTAQRISNVAVFIALEDGHFARWGLDVRLIEIREANQAWPALIAGQLDAYGGTFSAGLMEAIGRGARLRIVADKGYAGPGDRSNTFMVRLSPRSCRAPRAPLSRSGRISWRATLVWDSASSTDISGVSGSTRRGRRPGTWRLSRSSPAMTRPWCGGCSGRSSRQRVT